VLVVDANVVVEVTLERFGVKALDMLGDEQPSLNLYCGRATPIAIEAKSDPFSGDP
jgi:hypothetical protein